MKEKQRFERVVVSREEALAMFQENKFKVEIISGLKAVGPCSPAGLVSTLTEDQMCGMLRRIFIDPAGGHPASLRARPKSHSREASCWYGRLKSWDRGGGGHYGERLRGETGPEQSCVLMLPCSRSGAASHTISKVFSAISFTLFTRMLTLP